MVAATRTTASASMHCWAHTVWIKFYYHCFVKLMQYLKGGKFVRVTLISLWLPFSADHAHSISLSLFSLTLTEPFFAAAAFSHYIGQISLSFVAKYCWNANFAISNKFAWRKFSQESMLVTFSQSACGLSLLTCAHNYRTVNFYAIVRIEAIWAGAVMNVIERRKSRQFLVRRIFASLSVN